MPGQGTIVATGAIGYPPGLTAADPARLKEVGLQKAMTMTSTYDHRVNQGGLGPVAAVPVLVPGEGTILATGAIGCPPGLTAADPARLKELGVQKVMTMTSTYDHRVIQGAESGSFLRRVDDLLQGADGFYDSIFGALGVDQRDDAAAAAASGPSTVTSQIGRA